MFVTKMPVARIVDIANVMNECLADGRLEIKQIGTKPGEKLYEELMNDEEVRRTFEIEEYFLVLSAFTVMTADKYPLIKGKGKPNRPYNSSHESILSYEDVKEYLLARSVI